MKEAFVSSKYPFDVFGMHEFHLILYYQATMELVEYLCIIHFLLFLVLVSMISVSLQAVIRDAISYVLLLLLIVNDIMLCNKF